MKQSTAEWLWIIAAFVFLIAAFALLDSGHPGWGFLPLVAALFCGAQLPSWHR